MRVARRPTPMLTLLLLVFIAGPIVIGVALVSLALAYGNNLQLAVGIVLLGGGLGAEACRNLFL